VPFSMSKRKFRNKLPATRSRADGHSLGGELNHLPGVSEAKPKRSKLIAEGAPTPQDLTETAAHAWLGLILIVSAAIRAVLCVRGGQFFWIDEGRYLRSWGILRRLPHPLKALDTVLGFPDHWFYSLLGTVPATLQYAVMRLRGGPAIPDMAAVAASAWISALCFSVSGLACIVLVYAIARRGGGDRQEALLAAFLMACSTSLTIYSRHLLPYDPALAFALLALWLGLKQEAGVGRSVLCGLVAAAAFGAYNGYWLLAAVVLAVHVLWAGWRPLAIIRRALAAGAAFVFPLVALEALSRIRRLPSFIGGMREFSRTVTQGDYAEGWSLPWAYLWHCEHLQLVLWLVASAALAVMVIRQRDVRQRGIAWLATAAAIYAGLVLTSVVLHVFVVYGRNAREMVPFFCLAAAPALAALLRRVGNRGVVAVAVCALIAAQAAWNLARPLVQRFPVEASRLAAPYAPLRHASSFGEGTPTFGDCAYHARAEAEDARYVLMNTCLDMPIIPGLPAPSGRVIFHFPHPLQYKPYPYEGFPPEERVVIRFTDGSMKLIDTNKGGR
jgi:hypothetical protein